MQEPNSPEWTAPPPPEHIAPKEQPEMSELASLGNIFIEPGRTFEDMRRKPRFILAIVIMSMLITAFSFGIYYKVGDKGMREFASQQLDKNPQTSSMSGQQRESALDLGMTIGTVIRYILPVFMIIFFLIGGLIYWLASKAFGGSGGYLQSLSTWVYGSFPPTVVAMLCNFIALTFKNVDDIDIAAAQNEGGLLPSSLGALIPKTMPMVGAFGGMFDLFLIWGWVLGIIGLKKTLRLSSGLAMAITIILIVIQLLFRLVRAAFQ